MLFACVQSKTFGPVSWPGILRYNPLGAPCPGQAGQSLSISEATFKLEYTVTMQLLVPVHIILHFL